MKISDIKTHMNEMASRLRKYYPNCEYIEVEAKLLEKLVGETWECGNEK